jgi:hypothetical protein
MNRPFAWGDANQAMPRDDLAGAGSAAQCALCGIVLAADLMVPDGGQACADIRWYCQDARACTERWTANSRLAPPASIPAAPDQASAESGEPRPGENPDPVPATRRVRAPRGRGR